MSVASEPAADAGSWFPPDPGWESLVDMLEARAAASPYAKAYEFVQHDGATTRLQFGALADRARVIAHRLGETTAPGAAAVLVYPPGLEFIEAFFGCLYAGVRPAPVALSLLPDGLRKIAAVAASAGAKTALATGVHAGRLQQALAAAVPDTRWIATDRLSAAGDAGPWRAAAKDLAFLQYSSGSTGQPKGVEITHGNALHALSLLTDAFGVGPQDSGVSWLPHGHDMGLVAGVLLPIYSGAPNVLMSPLSFLIRPADWLATISRSRATISAGPDFAYQHCARMIPPEVRSHLDLSSWRVAITGSEPIRAETLDAFAQAFAPCGFDPAAFFPAYGLAEATLMVSGPGRGKGASIFEFDASALEDNRATPPGAGAVRRVVGCGAPRAGVVIGDAETGEPLPPGRVGEILVAGPSVSPGYHRMAEETAAAFHPPASEGSGSGWLRTGDLGFLHDGQLCVVGRLKDLIIVRGRNLHPQDLEDAVAGADVRFRGGRAAAFATESASGETLTLVQEIDAEAVGDPPTLQTLLETIRDALRSAHGVEAGCVVLTPLGQVPKTSSGKVQRRLCRNRHRSGTLRVLARWPAG